MSEQQKDGGQKHPIVRFLNSHVKRCTSFEVQCNKLKM